MQSNKNNRLFASIDDLVSRLRDRIAAVLPPDKPADRYVATIAEYLRRNAALFECERFSLERAIIDAAIMGFELGPPHDLAEILPYKNKSQGKIARLIIEYRGRMVEVYRTGRIKAIDARVVYKADKFDFELGQRPRLSHQPTIIGPRGSILYAYAIAQLTDGGTAFEVITQHDADKARKDSPGADMPGSLWKTREAEMWTKTAIKKLASRLPRVMAPERTNGGPDPPASPEIFDLLKAISISPDLYTAALKTLGIESPSDFSTIKTTLQHMRQLYRVKHTNTTDEPTNTQHEPTD